MRNFLFLLVAVLNAKRETMLIYDRSGLKRPVVFPADKEIPVFIIRNNLRTLKISHDEYLEILKKI
ncbi:MAG TPA: hypothetical protein VMX76_04030 [Nevskiaceae bacterium]|nr:hypothetical protein [Nevskiaceae bacterium]